MRLKGNFNGELLTPERGYDPRSFAQKLIQAITRDRDRRLVLNWKLDTSQKHAWMRMYYPNVSALATAEVGGCVSSCVVCWSPRELRYPNPALADEMVRKIPGAGFFTGAEVAERLAGMGRNVNMVQQRVTGAEPTLTPQWLLDFCTRSFQLNRMIALETNGLGLAWDDELAKTLTQLLSAKKEQVRITSHILAPTPDVLTMATDMAASGYKQNLDGIARLEEIGAEHHRVLLAWIPRLDGDWSGSQREASWSRSLERLSQELMARGIDPLGVELRPLRPFKGAIDEMKLRAIPTGRRDLIADFELTVRCWKRIHPNYELLFSWPMKHRSADKEARC